MAEAALQFPGTTQQGEFPGAQQPVDSAAGGATMPGAPVQTEGGRGGFLGKLFGKGEKASDAPAAQGISPMTLPQRPDIAAGMTDVAGRIGLNVEPVIGGAPRITAPSPDSGMVIGADTPSNGTIVDEGAKMIVKRPWEGGRRPSGAVQSTETAGSDAVSQISGSQGEASSSNESASAPAGLGTSVGNNESGDSVSMDHVEEPDTASTDVQGAEGIVNADGSSNGSETAATSGDATLASNSEDVVHDGAQESNAQEKSDEQDMSGVGVPPAGETYPNMAAPMTSVWSKPGAGEPSVDSDPDSGVAVPAPRELTPDEEIAKTDREEADADRQKLVDEGLGEDRVPDEEASDTAPAGGSAAPGDSFVAQMKDQGVITGEGQDQVIDATTQVATDVPVEPAMRDEVVGQIEEATEASAPAENAATEAPALPADQPVAEGEDGINSAPAEAVINDGAGDGGDTSGQSEDGASDDDGNADDVTPQDPYRAAMEKDPANDPARILEDLHKSDALSTADNAGSVLSGMKEANQASQEEADRLAEMPLRDAIQELRGKDEGEVNQLIKRLAWAHAFKNLEKQGITTLSSVEDTKKVTEEIRGMQELLKLFLEESGEKGTGWKATSGLTEPVEEPNDPSGASLIKTADAA